MDTFHIQQRKCFSVCYILQTNWIAIKFSETRKNVKIKVKDSLLDCFKTNVKFVLLTHWRKSLHTKLYLCVCVLTKIHKHFHISLIGKLQQHRNIYENSPYEFDIIWIIYKVSHQKTRKTKEKMLNGKEVNLLCSMFFRCMHGYTFMCVLYCIWQKTHTKQKKNANNNKKKKSQKKNKNEIR